MTTTYGHPGLKSWNIQAPYPYHLVNSNTSWVFLPFSTPQRKHPIRKSGQPPGFDRWASTFDHGDWLQFDGFLEIPASWPSRWKARTHLRSRVWRRLDMGSLWGSIGTYGFLLFMWELYMNWQPQEGGRDWSNSKLERNGFTNYAVRPALLD